MELNFPVYFSSVYAPENFEVVWEKKHLCRMNNKNTIEKEIIEKLFWNGIKTKDYAKTTLF